MTHIRNGMAARIGELFDEFDQFMIDIPRRCALNWVFVAKSDPRHIESSNVIDGIFGWRSVNAIVSFEFMFAIATLMALIQSVSGTPYVPGGDSPAGTDCSGLASWVSNVATGRPVHGSRFHTGNEESALLARGFQYGVAPNAVVIGWNSRHTAVTLPDGTAVSSGEGGGVRVGGRVPTSRSSPITCSCRSMRNSWMPILVRPRVLRRRAGCASRPDPIPVDPILVDPIAVDPLGDSALAPPGSHTEEPPQPQPAADAPVNVPVQVPPYSGAGSNSMRTMGCASTAPPIHGPLRQPCRS